MNNNNKRFNIGDKVRLIKNDASTIITAKIGAKAIVVNGYLDFPKHYKKLISMVGPSIMDEFIFVKWDKDDINVNGQEGGAYHKSRFEKVINGTKTKIIDSSNKIFKDNNGRATCFKCGKETIKIEGFTDMYDCCPKCKI